MLGLTCGSRPSPFREPPLLVLEYVIMKNPRSFAILKIVIIFINGHTELHGEGVVRIKFEDFNIQLAWVLGAISLRAMEFLCLATRVPVVSVHNAFVQNYLG